MYAFSFIIKYWKIVRVTINGERFSRIITNPDSKPANALFIFLLTPWSNISVGGIEDTVCFLLANTSHTKKPWLCSHPSVGYEVLGRPSGHSSAHLHIFSQRLMMSGSPLAWGHICLLYEGEMQTVMHKNSPGSIPFPCKSFSFQNNRQHYVWIIGCKWSTFGPIWMEFG